MPGRQTTKNKKCHRIDANVDAMNMQPTLHLWVLLFIQQTLCGLSPRAPPLFNLLSFLYICVFCDFLFANV